MWYIDVYVDDEIIASSYVYTRDDAIGMKADFRTFYGNDVLISVTYDDE